MHHRCSLHGYTTYLRGSIKAGLGVIAARIASLGIKGSGDKLLRTLKEGSDILEKQRTDFVTFSKEFRLVCLYEAYPTAGSEVSIHPTENLLGIQSPE